MVNLLITSESVKLQTTDNSLDLFVYPVGSALKFSEGLTIIKNSENVFDKYSLTFPRKAIDLEWQEDVNMLSQLKNSIAPSRPSPSLLKQYYPLYDTVLAQVEGARYWKVKIPSDIFQGVSEVFLKIDYEGDTQAVYLNSKLIADNFFAGEPMILGLKRFEVEVDWK